MSKYNTNKENNNINEDNICGLYLFLSMPEHPRKIYENSCICKHRMLNFFLHRYVSQFPGINGATKIMEVFYKLVWTASI